MRDICRLARLFCAALLLSLLLPIQPAVAATDSFSYQGSIELSGQPADGECDFQFTLWDAAGSGSPPAGGNQLAIQLGGGVAVTKGLFSVALDFGPFDNSDRWLQIAARCPANSGAFTTLAPRQPLRAVPFASYANDSGDLSCSACVQSSELANGAVVRAKINSGAVGSTEIGDGEVASIDIADGAITSADLANGTVAAIDIDATTVQRRVTGSCVGFGLMSQINQDGTVLCAPPATGDISSVAAGSGLSGGGLSGDVTLNANFAGSGSATSVARSDHNHYGQSWAGVGAFGLEVNNSASNGGGLRGLANFGANATGVYGQSDSGNGVFGYSSNNLGVLGQSIGGIAVLGSSSGNNGVEGRTFGLNRVGVRGIANNNNSIGVHGTADSNSSFGVQGDSLAGTGVYGTSTGSYGVRGFSSTSLGVYGTTGATLLNGGVGVRGESTVAAGVGVHGVALNDTRARGVWGLSTQGNGVYGESNSGIGISGHSQGNTGVQGESEKVGGAGVSGLGDASNAVGVLGVADSGSSAVGVSGTSASGRGVSGSTQAGGSSGDGVRGESTGANGSGVHGVANSGTSAYGIWGQSTSGFAGFFGGKVNVTGALNVEGTLTKAAGAFKIDHPLDPANRYLSHSFVESPDMKNIYDGNVLLDGNGEAVVQMPAWFEALNQDFRYQLTCIGANAPVFIADEISDNRFRIAGGLAGLKVSWQVTGVRHDAYANAHRIPLEEDKTQAERGRYMHPTEAGQPEAMGMQMVDSK